MDADDGVLIALMNQPRDLEIARTQHWYRIPAKRAPAYLTQARYLAFYLTKNFGDAKWTIREYAPIRGHELVRRRDLFPDQSDHPRANEAYFKLQLGTLIALPRPILSRRGRRLLFLWTNGAKFLRAVEINDLLGTSAEDDALWSALKSSGIDAERHITVRDARARYRVDFWIACRRGNLAIQLGTASRRMPTGKPWRTLYFTSEHLARDLPNCVQQITKSVRELGGITDSQGSKNDEHSH